VIHRHVVREHGIALAVPIHARSSIRSTPQSCASVVSLLHGGDADADVSPWLDNPFYRSYAVLTMCRMHYTLQYGVVVSKPLAARWAQTTLDARWTPLIQAALDLVE